jgi:hypothetical protein
MLVVTLHPAAFSARVRKDIVVEIFIYVAVLVVVALSLLAGGGAAPVARLAVPGSRAVGGAVRAVTVSQKYIDVFPFFAHIFLL